jgi:hypothetical protein
LTHLETADGAAFKKSIWSTCFASNPYAGFLFPDLNLRFQDDVWRWNADRITADFDEFQRELIVENTRAGLAATRMRGRRGGRALVLDKEGIRVAEAMSSITSGSGGRSSNDISRRIGSGNFEIRPEQRLQTVSFYVPLSKRTHR